MPMLRPIALVLVLLPLAPPAWAAEATPEGARALEQSVRGWMAGLVGPVVSVPERPVQITPNGDHYDVRIPLGDPAASPGTAITAGARMLDGGKWSIDSIRIPSPAQFTVQLPSPPKEGEKTPGPLVPVTYDLTLGQQSNQILFDPSYATASTLTSSLQDFSIKADGNGIAQTSHADRSNTVSTLRPAGGDRVDLVTDSTLENYTINQQTGDLQPFKMVMQRARITGEVTGASRSRATEIMQTVLKVGAAAMAGAPKDPAATVPKMDPKTVKLLLSALLDFASGMTLEETIDQLAISYGDFGGTVAQARLGMTAKAPGGILQAQVDLGMQGLALPDLPLGDMAALIPTKVALRPMVSGIAVADLARMVDSAGDNTPPKPADIAALFSHGGISTGLESFAIDVAGSSFTGMGTLLFTAPEAFTGTAQVTATNLDALQQRVAGMPALAQQALPIFIFAKGIGRTVGTQMVWDVTYRDGKVLVNGQDMTALAGGGAPAEPQPKARPTRPQQQQRQRP